MDVRVWVSECLLLIELNVRVAEIVRIDSLETKSVITLSSASQFGFHVNESSNTCNIYSQCHAVIRRILYYVQTDDIAILFLKKTFDYQLHHRWNMERKYTVELWSHIDNDK